MLVLQPGYKDKPGKAQNKERCCRPGRWLTLYLLGAVALIMSFAPVFSFSGYVQNLSFSFPLRTSAFYLVPSLESGALTVDMADGFTREDGFTVANYVGSNYTAADIAYTITLTENRETPLFDLYAEDGAGEKIICPDNTISHILTGGSAVSHTHTLYFKLKDLSTPAGSYPVTIKLTSTGPYIRSYNFIVNIQINTSMVLIEGTEDIYRPNVEIPEDEVMVFKDDQYILLSADDLLQPLVIDEVVEDLERPDLIGGSLYVPAEIGTLQVGSGQTINWDVHGNIVLGPDIEVNINSRIDMVSRTGNVVLNDTTISGDTIKPYIVNVTAESGRIDAVGTVITTKPDGNGIISIQAEGDINVSGAQITAAGNKAINIQSSTGGIEAGGAVIKSISAAPDAAVIIQAEGQINLDGATVESKASTIPPEQAMLIKSTAMGISAVNASLTSTNSGKSLEIIAQEDIVLDQTTISSQGPLVISSIGDISARSAGMVTSGYGNDIEITSTNGYIDLSSLETSGTVLTSNEGSIYITSQGDIFVISAQISASTSWAMELQFESTGTGSKLWVEDAVLSGYSIKSHNLEIVGTTASGTIINV